MFSRFSNSYSRVRRVQSCAFLLLLYICYLIYKRGCYKWKHPKVATLFYSHFFGTFKWLVKNANCDDMHDRLVKECHILRKTHGQPIVNYGSMETACLPAYNFFIFDKNLIKYVFDTKFECFVKSDRIRVPFQELLGDGIFSLDYNNGWAMHRKVASRMFSMRNLKHYIFDCAVNNCQTLIAKMIQLSNNDGDGDGDGDRDGDGNVIDLFEIFGRFTLESFVQSAFGEKLGCIESLPKPHAFCTAFDLLTHSLEMRYVDPFWQLKRLFKVGEREGKVIPECVRILDSYAYEVIAKRSEKNISDERGQKNDLLSLFMNSNIGREHEHDADQDNGAVVEEELPPLHAQQLRDITMNFIIAARDTTRILLSWFFFEVTKPKHRRILSQILREIDAHKHEQLTYYDCSPVLSATDTGVIDIQTETPRAGTTGKHKYAYVEAALCETLRLHPPVPWLQRYAKDDISVPYVDRNGSSQTLHLKKGNGVCIYTNSFLTMEENWPKPFEFNPMRFYPNGVSSYDMYEFPVFNLKPRLCLGRHVALMQAKICAISLLRQFELMPVDGQVVCPVYSPVLGMKYGFKVRIRPRRSDN